MRLRLLSLVASYADREACVCDLNDAFDLSQPTISHHLKVLHEVGLLDREQARCLGLLPRARRGPVGQSVPSLGAVGVIPISRRAGAELRRYGVPGDGRGRFRDRRRPPAPDDVGLQLLENSTGHRCHSGRPDHGATTRLGVLQPRS